ncbi:MAG TPA: DNA polymerase III subunit alpha [bacterium]|nr:DNA polymerase III subunit alpha [bacterium]
MQPPKFVHLHLHTQYSLLDGAITIDALVAKCKALGMPAVAITDHGNLFGGIEFYQAATKKGIKPILGCEIYIQSDGSRFEKKIRPGREPYHHLTLLAQDLEGYRNLCKIITSGYLEGFYYKPRTDKEFLKEHSKGIIALSGCLSGEMAEAAMSGGVAGARRVAEDFRAMFDDRFYLEVQGSSLPEQKRLNNVLFELSKELSIPAVATNDCHYLNKEDAPMHEALLCIQTGKTLQDEDRMRFSTDEFYMHTAEEMAALFPERLDVVEASAGIAERCDLHLDFKTYYFPKFEPPAEKTLDQHLEEETWKGFEERWAFIKTVLKDENPDEVRNKYVDRLKGELEMIRKMGFSGYFLIVADFINYAKKHDIPVGPGRGSAAGSLVAFCLAITDIDPIPYNLLFERFLNPERVSMPDMDIDFCMNQREKVIAYVQQKYGNVSQIITFGKMKAKAVIRDVGRVMNMAYKDVDKIAKLVPNTLNITLEDALKAEPQLRDLESKDSQVKQLLKIGRALEGLTRHASTHAAGIVMSDQPLVNFMPLYKGNNDEIVAQYDMKAIEKIGLIKFDFLGLKTLTVIDDTVKTIQKTRGIRIKINEIPLDDAQVYKDLSTGDTTGIFQLESSGMRELIIKMKPSVFPDLIALVALYRPGPLGSGMVDEFINRKHGKVPVKYELPVLENILRETYGIIVYQEQVMQIASAMAGFSLGDADILRRAMGKKKAEEMLEQRGKFLEGCEKNKINPKKSEKIFDLMAKFAEYGFNKSHSAAYAFVSYQTAYLKTHYPTEYTAALLTHDMGNTDKVLQFIQDAREHDIKILPPDINESSAVFTVVGDSTGERQIRFGLAAVKNVGEAAIESVIESRVRVGGFKTFSQFCGEIDGRKVNRRVVESLVKCGAFDSLGVERARIFAAIETEMETAARQQKSKATGQSGLFDAAAGDGPAKDVLPQIPEWPQKEKLSFEKESLGFYITGHPLADVASELKQRTSLDTEAIRNFTEEDSEKNIAFGGIVSSLRETVTKKGNKMGFVTLEDLKGTIPVIVFSDLYARTAGLLQTEEPLFVRGTVDVEEESVKIIAREIVRLKDLMAVNPASYGSAPYNAPQSPGKGSGNGRKEVHFHLPEGLTRDQLQTLKTLLARHLGESPAFIHLKDAQKGETILVLPEGMKVNPSHDMMREVDQLFGSPVTILH